MTTSVFIPKWHPTRLNQLLTVHWATANKKKKNDKSIVRMYCVGKPKATCKRRVDLHIVMKKNQKAADPDAYWKSLLDALVTCGMLKDDSPKWCELGSYTVSRDWGDWGSRIVLTDIDNEESR